MQLRWRQPRHRGMAPAFRARRIRPQLPRMEGELRAEDIRPPQPLLVRLPRLAQKPLPPGSLLCTVGEGFDIDSYASPPDGLCTITVFDSLYTPEGSKLTPPYNEDFELFLDAARGSEKTEYAIGFDANSTTRNDTAMELLVRNITTTNFLDYFWERNRVFHYAQVNAPLRSTAMNAATSVEYAARSLQMISSLMDYKKSPTDRPSYTIIFHTLYSNRNGELVAEKLR
ncbi:hypothetical protein HPB50_023806 [Hyalomma asiaticum]|uniref:Uncharacterized protein n=1 Tax=Hyalomma asiaticum TaxID=266040 RepID=A0ACB7SW33_HYAAI|nr:hypothetical protein HPB50_023806 [Hyalomma asiaticum]